MEMDFYTRRNCHSHRRGLIFLLSSRFPRDGYFLDRRGTSFCSVSIEISGASGEQSRHSSSSCTGRRVQMAVCTTGFLRLANLGQHIRLLGRKFFVAHTLIVYSLLYRLSAHCTASVYSSQPSSKISATHLVKPN
jgi:hypothetical protein